MSHKYEGPRPRRQIDPHLTQFFVKIIRDLGLFALGAYGFIHELQRSGAERPQILIMCAAMVGLPWIIRGDERRQEVKANGTRQAGGDGSP